MKKLFFTIVAFYLLGIFTSCNNNEIYNESNTSLFKQVVDDELDYRDDEFSTPFDTSEYFRLKEDPNFITFLNLIFINNDYFNYLLVNNSSKLDSINNDIQYIDSEQLKDYLHNSFGDDTIYNYIYTITKLSLDIYQNHFNTYSIEDSLKIKSLLNYTINNLIDFDFNNSLELRGECELCYSEFVLCWRKAKRKEGLYIVGGIMLGSGAIITDVLIAAGAPESGGLSFLLKPVAGGLMAAAIDLMNATKSCEEDLKFCLERYGCDKNQKNRDNGVNMPGFHWNGDNNNDDTFGNNSGTPGNNGIMLYWDDTCQCYRIIWTTKKL